MTMEGIKTARIFKKGETPVELTVDDDFSEFLKDMDK